jgi:hypothetical protein
MPWIIALAASDACRSIAKVILTAELVVPDAGGVGVAKANRVVVFVHRWLGGHRVLLVTRGRAPRILMRVREVPSIEGG